MASVSNPQKDPILILGMSRSGTSITSALLQAGGMWLGDPEQFVKPLSHNPSGFYEYEPITDLNEELLRHLGGESSIPPRFPEGWELDPSLKPFYQRADAILQRLSEGGRWSCKDPRLSLLLPFWKALVPKRRFVVCVRHPLEVADSVGQHFQIPRDRAVDLWTTYSRAACAGTQGEERLFVSYEALMENPKAQGARLFEFCGLNPAGPDAAISRIQSGLRHHRHGLQELENAYGGTEALATYRWMLSQADQPVPDRMEVPQQCKVDDGIVYTGERYVPGAPIEVGLEHLHRYVLARPLAQGKDVLDIASGEGYGSALLSQVAATVTGVDIDPQAVAHASQAYPRPNLDFRQGSCSQIPLADASMDLVASFETLEHHGEHHEMLREIKRVLRPGGICMISSPDKRNYSDKPGYKNEFHVKELYKEEFEKLLSTHFARHALYAQRSLLASLIQPDKGQPQLFNFWKKGAQIFQSAALNEPTIWLALASDGPIPALESGIFEGSVRETELFKEALQDQARAESLYSLAKRLLKKLFYRI